MISKKTVGLVALLAGIMSSFQVYASTSFSVSQEISQSSPPDIVLQTPQIPDVQVQELPKSTEIGVKVDNRYCNYAAYRIDKQGFRPRGDDVTFEVRVTNIGNCNLSDIYITDFFPEGTRFEDSWPSPDFIKNRDKAVWSVKWLPVGTSFRIIVKFDIRRPEWSRWVTNSACAWNAMIGQQICAWDSVWFDRR